MRLFEITQPSSFHPLLLKFWKSCSQNDLTEYFVLGNCFEASKDLSHWLYFKANMGRGEVIKIGYLTKKTGQLKQGWIQTDVVQHEYDDFHSYDFDRMYEQNLDPRKEKDRLAYIKNNNLEEKFKMIPHSWVEVRSNTGILILDPSGFYIDGVSGQFDKMVTDKSNLQSRYHYFK